MNPYLFGRHLSQVKLHCKWALFHSIIQYGYNSSDKLPQTPHSLLMKFAFHKQGWPTNTIHPFPISPMNTIFFKDGGNQDTLVWVLRWNAVPLKIKQQSVYFLLRVKHTVHLSPSVHYLFNHRVPPSCTLQPGPCESQCKWLNFQIRTGEITRYMVFVQQHSPTKVPSH